MRKDIRLLKTNFSLYRWPQILLHPNFLCLFFQTSSSFWNRTKFGPSNILYLNFLIYLYHSSIDVILSRCAGARTTAIHRALIHSLKKLPYGSFFWQLMAFFFFLKSGLFGGVLEKVLVPKKVLGSVSFRFMCLIIHSEEKTKLGIKATNSININ